MAYFSPFWAKNYSQIGFCCIFYPLESNYMYDKDGSGQRIERKLIEYIDTAWMDEKKLKWIGHDREGYKAWVDKSGSIYRLSDLQRNEEGKIYERETGKLKIAGDGSSQLLGSGSVSGDFYEWELSVLKRCGFCPGGGGGSASDADQEEKEEEEKDTNIPAWQDLAQGKVTNYAAVHGSKGSFVTDTGDTVYNGNITDSNIATDAQKYGGSVNAIPALPYSGNVPLPTSVPNPQALPYLPIPGLVKNPVTETAGIVTKRVMPTLKKDNGFIYDGQPVKPGLNKPKPASVGTYRVVPTVPKPFKMPDFKKPEYKLPTPAIDKLIYDIPSDAPDESKYKEKEEDERFDKNVDQFIDELAGKNENIEKLNDGRKKALTFGKAVYDLAKLASIRQKMLDAKKAGNLAAANNYQKQLATAEIDWQEDYLGIFMEAAFEEQLAPIEFLKILQYFSETSTQYLAQQVLFKQQELKNPNLTNAQRNEIYTEYKRLLEKFKEKIE